MNAAGAAAAGAMARCARSPSHRLSVAPMMDWTDRHFRHLMRLLSPDAMLYTEMHVVDMLKHAPHAAVRRALAFDDEHGQVTVQLGGSDPDLFAAAAVQCEEFGYDEINVNVGCPSQKVAGKGCFGAALMRDPDTVARIAAATSEAVGGRLPVSIKCRIGVVNDADELFPAGAGRRPEALALAQKDHDARSFDSLARFVDRVHARSGGVATHFVVHARCAVLGGLASAKENRNVPPLRYDVVDRLARERPHLDVSINGGVRSPSQLARRLAAGAVSGVMVGRVVRDDPFALAALSEQAFPSDGPARDPSRDGVVRDYADYLRALPSLGTASSEGSRGVSAHTLLKPVLNMYRGQPGGRLFRHRLSDALAMRKAGLRVRGERPPLEDTAIAASDALEAALEALVENRRKEAVHLEVWRQEQAREGLREACVGRQQ
jgi:tRNA-dihydrouridine synthase A